MLLEDEKVTQAVGPRQRGEKADIASCAQNGAAVELVEALGRHVLDGLARGVKGELAATEEFEQVAGDLSFADHGSPRPPTAVEERDARGGQIDHALPHQGTRAPLRPKRSIELVGN